MLPLSLICSHFISCFTTTLWLLCDAAQMHFHSFLTAHLHLTLFVSTAMKLSHGLYMMMPGGHSCSNLPAHLHLLPHLSVVLQMPHGLYFMLPGVLLHSILPAQLPLPPSVLAALQLPCGLDTLLHIVHLHNDSLCIYICSHLYQQFYNGLMASN